MRLSTIVCSRIDEIFGWSRRDREFRLLIFIRCNHSILTSVALQGATTRRFSVLFPLHYVTHRTSFSSRVLYRSYREIFREFVGTNFGIDSLWRSNPQLLCFPPTDPLILLKSLVIMDFCLFLKDLMLCGEPAEIGSLCYFLGIEWILESISPCHSLFPRYCFRYSNGSRCSCHFIG
jgi:hypothetical protein